MPKMTKTETRVVESVRQLTDAGAEIVRLLNAGETIDAATIDGRNLRSPKRLGLIRLQRRKTTFELTHLGRLVAEKL